MLLVSTVILLKLVRRFWRKWALLIFLTATVLTVRVDAGELKEQYRIKDHGVARDFELAKDELHVVTKTKERKAQKVETKANAEDIRKAARELQSSSGDEVDLVLYEKDRPRTIFTRRVVTKKIVAQLAPEADPIKIAVAARVKFRRRLSYAPEFHIFEVEGPGDSLEAAEALRAVAGVVSAEPLLEKEHSKKMIPDDTLFNNQWHLRNTGQGGGAAGIDANVTSVWDNYRGAGVNIGIIDDGLQFTHPDLAPNANTAIDHDFFDNDSDPTPSQANQDWHGSSVAGVAAARGNNALGVCGVAFEATLVGLRLTAGGTSDLQEADSFAYMNDVIAIKSNSWGPADDGKTLEAPGPLALSAIAQAAQNGRGGKGTIFTWAGGNGLESNDNSNYDGYANSIYTIAVAALTDTGRQAYYSEPGANLVVTAPSNGGVKEITTTDLTGTNGYNTGSTSGELSDANYTQTFGGTSSATPLVSGVIALMLQANPNLGWRDVQEILIRSATKDQLIDTDWINNRAGFHFNHKFGAGLVNAQAAVNMALTWTNLPPAGVTTSAQTGLSVAIPDNNATGITRSFVISGQNRRVEHVTVTAGITHSARGNLEIILTSPVGTQSRLAELHNDNGDHYSNWTFMSVRNWGESSTGTWTVKISDRKSSNTGTLNSLQLNIYGTSTGAVVTSDTAVLTAESNIPANNAADPGETVTFNFALKNIGAAATQNLVATLLATGGVTSPSAPQTYGAISSAGGTVAKPFTFKANGMLGSPITATLQLQDGAANLVNVTFSIPLGTATSSTFTTSSSITIPASGSASPYPSNLVVSGLNGTVTKVTATLTGLGHAFPRDIDLLLVGPTGASIVPMSDAGGSSAVSNLTLTFDDAAAATIPSTSISSGTFQPTDYTTGDSFPSPAPTGTPSSTLSAFNGLNPNGTWKLYAVDDATPDSGSIGGWSLTFTTLSAVDNVLFSVANYTVDESAGSATITVERTGGNGGTAAVNYATSNGTATAGADYTAVSNTLNFAVGQTSRTFSIPITNDGIFDGNETINLTLSNATGGATLGHRTNAVLTIIDADTDGDTLPDDWETTYGLNPASAADATLDTDGDGFTNVQEFTAGTTPNSGASIPRITQIQPSGTNFEISFPTVVGKKYRVEYRDGLTTGTWLVLQDNIDGTGSSFSVFDSSASSLDERFYRLVVLP